MVLGNMGPVAKVLRALLGIFVMLCFFEYLFDDNMLNELATSMAKGQGALPNLLLLGAQKGGTTAMAGWLFQNGVCGGETFEKYKEPKYYRKEMHFFDFPDRLARGKEFYWKHYRHCRKENKTIIMDATPDYLRYPDQVYELYKDDPNLNGLKIVVSLREPMDRELSWYNHMVDKVKTLQKESGPIEEPWTKVAYENGTIKAFPEYVETVTIPDLDDYEAPSSVAHYSLFLSRLFDLFDPEQILVISYEEDVRASGGLAKQRIQDFLGQPSLSTKGPFGKANAHESPSKIRKIPCSVAKRLAPIFEPWNQEVYHLLATTKRPPMEISPFPKFQVQDCDPDDVEN